MPSPSMNSTHMGNEQNRGLEKKNSLKNFIEQTSPVLNTKEKIGYMYKFDGSLSVLVADNFDHSCSTTVESSDQSASLSDLTLYPVSQVANLQVDINKRVMEHTKRKNELTRQLQSALEVSKARHETGSRVGAALSMRRVQRLRNELQRLKVLHGKLMEIFLQVDVELNSSTDVSASSSSLSPNLVDVDVPLHHESLLCVDEEVETAMAEKKKSGALQKTDAELLAELDELLEDTNDDENEYVDIDCDLLLELEELIAQVSSLNA